MRPYAPVRIALALAFASAALGFSAPSRAEPLITQGIGISNCAKLAADLKPSAGLDHQANYLLIACCDRQINQCVMVDNRSD